MSDAVELNFDGLVGPTHYYAGLAPDNQASQAHAGAASNPRAAALQGLAKMKRLLDLGLAQAVLPPQLRPDMAALHRLGFAGSDAQMLARAAREAPHILLAAASASSMWAANAATVSPAADCADHRLHLTVANLVSHLHRRLEIAWTRHLFEVIFADPAHFAVHDPLPACLPLADEGAANHTRLTTDEGHPGLEWFVYGHTVEQRRTGRAKGRHSREASMAVARLHQLDPARTLFAQQHPSAIDAGVFHNDVIAVGHRHVLLCHEQAWVDQPAVLGELRRCFREQCAGELVVIELTHDQVSLQRAVQSYVFNSQLLTRPDGRMGLLCPCECREDPRIADLLAELIEGDAPLRWVEYVDVRQSMHNGGGPACLRLRVTLTAEQRQSIPPGLLLTDDRYQQLAAWVQRHYREQLTADDLADPHLLDESREALDELTRLLELGSIYAFQQ